ncbi:MAG: sulfotransferase domain-containing protein [Stellaceae bacterium]
MTRFSFDVLTPGALVNSLTPRAVINIFHRFVTGAVIASYPKCGYTWLSSMLRQLIVDTYHLPPEKLSKVFVQDHRPSQVFNVPFGIPLIYHNHFIEKSPATPDLGNMLEILAPFRRTPMLIVFRDVKDVLVSYYMEAVFREAVPHFHGTVDEFARSDAYGVKKFVLYHNALAAFRRDSSAPTLIVRYEDLWSDTARTLKRSAEFLGIRGCNDPDVRRAVELWSLDNMQRMEDAAATPETALVPDLHRPPGNAAQGRRVRVGGSGNWRKHLSPDVAAWADDYVRRHLDPFFLEPGPERRGLRVHAN